MGKVRGRKVENGGKEGGTIDEKGREGGSIV